MKRKSKPAPKPITGIEADIDSICDWAWGNQDDYRQYTYDGTGKACRKSIAMIERLRPLLIAAPTLLEYLEESHEEEMRESHYGDAKRPGPDPKRCSYCRIIQDAKRKA